MTGRSSQFSRFEVRAFCRQALLQGSPVPTLSFLPKTRGRSTNGFLGRSSEGIRSVCSAFRNKR